MYKQRSFSAVICSEVKLSTSLTNALNSSNISTTCTSTTTTVTSTTSTTSTTTNITTTTTSTITHQEGCDAHYGSRQGCYGTVKESAAASPGGRCAGNPHPPPRHPPRWGPPCQCCLVPVTCLRWATGSEIWPTNASK
ncbi:hypothetical protein FHG87_013770 [Trinorchestia longiramus]|nr:hypothetical protein FHG87_013770 [Trinorchestia longiramus]